MYRTQGSAEGHEHLALLKFSYGPKPQNTMGREEREKPNPNFFPLKAKRSFEGREKQKEEKEPVNITRSEQKTINSRIAFQITRHLGLRTG